MLQGRQAIRDAYRDRDVAGRYVDQRFREPLGALLHARQAGTLRSLVRAHAPARALEIAPGPARLSVEVAPHLPGTLTLVEASREMIDVARERLAGLPGARVSIVHGDAFHLPLRGEFDFAYAFRFIRHFPAADRTRFYTELHRVLRPGALFVFDAVNERVSAPIRAADPDSHKHYDALFAEKDLRAEMRTAGFSVEKLVAVQRRFPALVRLQVLVAPRSRILARAAMEIVDRVPGGEPLEWIVVCRRA